MWSGYAGTTINRFCNFCIYSVPEVGSMEIQSFGGIRPPEGGGLAYPCLVPVYMRLYMVWLCRTTINRFFDFCIYSVPKVGSMEIQSLGVYDPRKGVVLLTHARCPYICGYMWSGYAGTTINRFFNFCIYSVPEVGWRSKVGAAYDPGRGWSCLPMPGARIYAHIRPGYQGRTTRSQH